MLYLIINTSWGRAVPSSGQVLFVKVISYLWVLSLAFQPSTWVQFCSQDNISNFFSSFLQVLYQNHLPGLLYTGNGYKKDLKNWIWKTTSNKRIQLFHHISSSWVRMKLHIKKIILLVCLMREIAMEKNF